ncbi:MAG: hypothetical protein LBM56_05970 [Burkholderiaceae bacterium]|jgi:LPS-assembly lipoprotein|nr:hypothetical protein [Burkholderiaceae bacterium]
MCHHPAFRGILIALLGAFLLSACGFALRGSGGSYKLPFKTVYMNLGTTSLFGATFKRHIESSGAKIVEDKKQADIQLEILDNQRIREVLSRSTAGRVREYALFFRFRFQIKDHSNKIVMGPVEILLRRTQTYSESEAYAKEKEADMLYEEMENDVMLQLIRRLANVRLDETADKEPPL